MIKFCLLLLNDNVAISVCVSTLHLLQMYLSLNSLTDIKISTVAIFFKNCDDMLLYF